MKTLTTYECEICGETYDEMKRAIQCEKEGIQEPFPVGLVFGNAKGFYKDITFCVAKSKRVRHYLVNALWACRDNGAGDSLGKDVCGDGHSTPNLELPDRAHPTFRRMIAYLKKRKIKPLMYQRGKMVAIK